ncbi:unnamed protein product [Cuscuta campestris]|uniref:C3H1-type domain-containing protein n=1 Tax=Cuscuta campestris TaxID=132261 RepID=A0A484N150_9ASTE|nr:unnamed protein product [Cuscuta campestris]
MHRNGDVSRYANSESETIEIQCQGKIPNAYDIENDQPRNNRGIITCKDFGRGNCRWGASCRFSHSEYSGQMYDGSIRNASSDYNLKPDSIKTSRPLCKYFVAGKCYTTNCRFSHDGPIRGNVETSHSNDIGGHRYDDNKHNLVGLKWDGVEMDPSFDKAPIGENVAKSNHLDAVHTDRVDPIGDPDLVNSMKLWNESAWDVGTAKMLNLEKTSEQVDSTVRENFAIAVPVDHNNNRWVHDLESERAMWQNTTLCEGRDVYPNVTATNASEYSLESLSNNKECNVISKASQLQSLGGSSVHGERHDTMEDASRIIFPSNSILPYGSPNPHLESYPFWGTGNSNMSNALNDVNIYRHSIHPELLPEQRFSEISKRANQGSEYSSFLDEAAQGEPMMHAIPSNGHSIIPNDSTDYQKKEAATTSEMQHFSMTQNLSGATFSVPTTRMRSPAPLTSEIWYESGKSQQHAAVPSSVVRSDSKSGLLPTYNAVYTQLDKVKIAPDLCQAAQARGDKSQMPDNFVMHANASKLSEQGTKDTSKELNQSSSLNYEVGNIKHCAASNVDCTKEQYLTHPDSVAKSEVNGNNRLISKCSEDEQQNNNPDNVDVPGKCEVVNGNKDDKVARLFKISLIESVKEILKPTWKEGQMSREVHKTIVKKVVDKVMGSIQGGHFPKTQDKIEHYLSHSKGKISKLAQAYVERSQKEHS